MMESISLLREKFTIRDVGLDETPTIALGNRLIIELPKKKDALVVRGHSMHMTLRYGAEIMRQLSYITHVEKPETLFQWDDIWQKLAGSYEKEANPSTWISLYYQGKIIYEDGSHHGFFDVIEQCEVKNKSGQGNSTYEKSIQLAQKAFQKMGRTVLIEEESHVGFILDNDPDDLRFAIILRMPGHKSTFITRMRKNPAMTDKPHDHTAMFLAADYIESINMAVRVGFMERNVPSAKSNKNELLRDIGKLNKRLQNLALSIERAEKKYNLIYRPDKPDFAEIKRKCMDG